MISRTAQRDGAGTYKGHQAPMGNDGTPHLIRRILCAAVVLVLSYTILPDGPVFSAEPGEANGPRGGPAPAVKWKGRDAVRIGLRKHTDLCEISARGWTELMCAAEHCEEDKVRLLLNKGADVNAVAKDGGTALMEAAGGGRYPPALHDWPLPKFLDDCAKLVKERTYKPDLGRQEFLETLSAGRRNRRARVVKLLLDDGADVHKRDNGGWTALMCAAKAGLSEVIRTLVERGAEVNTRNHLGDTPLILAALTHSPESVRSLVEAGANVNAMGHQGTTPLLAAARWGQAEQVRFLLERGADPHAKDNFGRTSLTEAAGRGRGEGMAAYIVQPEQPREEIVRMLLAAGVDVNARDNDGDTALRIARRSCWVNIPQVLERHGAEE